MSEANEYMVFSTIGDWPVKISPFKGDKPTADPEGESLAIYVDRHLSSSELLCSPFVSSRTGFVMRGKRHEVIFLAMILNSDIMQMQTKLLPQPFRVNTRTLKNIIVPPASILEIVNGSLLESFLFTAAMPRYAPNSTEELLQLAQPSISLLSLLQNYYVEQLFIPEVYSRFDIDIISGWREVSDKLKLDGSEEQASAFVSTLFKTIIRDGKNMMRDFNKVKVVQSQTIEALWTKLQNEFHERSSSQNKA